VNKKTFYSRYRAKRALNCTKSVNNQSTRFSSTIFVSKVYRAGSDAFVEKIQLFVIFFQKKFDMATKCNIITSLLFLLILKGSIRVSGNTLTI